MPTENRFGNTNQPQIEAASAAMSQIRTMLGREQRPDQVAAALEACDWSDSPIGNKAIVLSAIQVLRAMQPHAEPIAWMVGTAFWWTKEEAERDAAATGLPIVGLGPMTGIAPAERRQGKPAGYVRASNLRNLRLVAHCGAIEMTGVPRRDEDIPLYTHADPGEVDRQRTELAELHESQWKLTQYTNKLQAQLAERDALLRGALAELQAMKDEIGFRGNTLQVITGIEAALAASAKPSALPDPLGCNQCAHAECGKFGGPHQVECRAMADDACARTGVSS